MTDKVQLVDDPALPMLNGIAAFEISTDQPEVLKRFYGELFGWTFLGEPGTPYHVIRTPSEKSIYGGLWDNRVQEEARGRNWSIIGIQVDDVEAACVRAVEAGGTVMGGPEKSDGPDGTVYAHLYDPSGNQIGIFSRPVQHGD